MNDCEEPGNDGLIIIGKDGAVRIPDADEMKLVPAPGGGFILTDDTEEELAKVQLKVEEGQKVLSLTGDDGSVETWRMTTGEDGAPKMIPRRQGNIRRIFTKEGQQAKPEHEVEQPVSPKNERFDAATVGQLKKKFAELNPDSDGMLDIAKLKDLMQLGRVEMSEREVLGLFTRVDKDGTGKISFEAFVDFVFEGVA